MQFIYRRKKRLKLCRAFDEATVLKVHVKKLPQKEGACQLRNTPKVLECVFFYFFCFSFFQRVIGKLVPQDGSRLQHGILTFVDKKYGFLKIIIIINILTKERGEH